MQKCDKTVAKSSKFRLVAINVSYIVSLMSAVNTLFCLAMLATALNTYRYLLDDVALCTCYESR